MLYRTLGAVRLITALILLSSSAAIEASLSLDSAPTSGSIGLMLDGPGLAVSNVQVTKGIKGQYGLFSGGSEQPAFNTDPVLGIPEGLFMSTGNLGSILGPNGKTNYTYNTGTQYADPDLTKLASNATYDPVIVEFDIIPEGDVVNFLLVFGSEEFPEFVCSKFNDVFGLFVSGPGISGTRNAAFMPNSTTQTITVNNVNSGKAGSRKDGTACQLGNSMYFVDNGDGSGKTGTQLDGFTTPLTASLKGLQPKQSYHIKLALADAGDQAYDSAAFFKWLTSTTSVLADIELTGSASTTKPSKNGYVDLTYTVSNRSAVDTRLVQVNVDLPTGTTLFSENSGGNFDQHTNVWTVGALPANSSKTIKLHVLVGSDASYQIPAEVMFSFNQDPDSTPYNRLARPAEDDTSLLVVYPTNNLPPVITNNNRAATYQVYYEENQTTQIVDYQALDAEGETELKGLTWSLGGGSDDALFTLNQSGLLQFKNMPDFEQPLSTDKSNNYRTVVTVCDSLGACTPQALTVTVTDAQEDVDHDGLSDDAEIKLGSQVNNPDSDGDGVFDGIEVGSNPDTPLDTDQDGTPDLLDTDDDNDGIVTFTENYDGGTPTDDDTDKDGKPDYLDADDDNDGLPTRNENYNGKTPTDDDTNKDGISDYLDTDDDGDDVSTAIEISGPDGSNADTDHDGISNHRDTDDDGDGVPTQLENYNGGTPTDDDTDTDGITNYLDADDDGDTVPTARENHNGGTPLDDDTDADGQPDAIDIDDDNDGLLTLHENYNAGSPEDDDTDKDGKADYIDADDDGDGKPSVQERNDPNGNHLPDDAIDTDADKTPDYLDAHDTYDPSTDKDSDGLTNGEELALGSNPDATDSDNDSLPDILEVGLASKPLDSDHDGTLNLIDTDDDGDGVPTLVENNGKTAPTTDSDNDKVFDYLDTDDDNDGVLTLLENHNGETPENDDTDKDGKPDYLDIDDDGDGIKTWYENYNGNAANDDDTDQDDIPDYLDADDDNDGLLTLYEKPDPNGNGNPDDGRDFDTDGVYDFLDTDDDGDGKPTLTEQADPSTDGNPSDAMDNDYDSLLDYLDPVTTPFVRLQMRAFLQGAYNGATGLMENELHKQGYVPSKQPYDTLSNSFGYTNSPSTASPFAYSGTETLSATVHARTGKDAVVDWMLIDIRDAADPTRRRALKAAILERDGDMADATTGFTTLVIHGITPGNYYVATNHRNHLGVMTKAPVMLSETPTLHDFTLPSTPVNGDGNARISGATVSLLYAGDVNNSHSIIASGPGTDISVVLGALLIAPGNTGVNSSYQLNGYYATDANLDGKTVYAGPNNDTNLILGNVLMHPENTSFSANFTARSGLPMHK